jgi:hypothetical protein
MALPAGLQMLELYSFEQDHEKYVDDFIAYINYGGINDELSKNSQYTGPICKRRSMRMVS